MEPLRLKWGEDTLFISNYILKLVWKMTVNFLGLTLLERVYGRLRGKFCMWNNALFYRNPGMFSNSPKPTEPHVDVTESKKHLIFSVGIIY